MSRADSHDEKFVPGGKCVIPKMHGAHFRAWGAGFNWYLTQNVKWVLNYERTRFERGAAGAAIDRMRKRLQLAF
ncbi:MAG: porin [Gammaproteobacteria bacterium]